MAIDRLCTFCQILNGEAPASVVHSDHLVTAFMDIRPVNPGHLLIIPNIHAASLAELPEEHGRHMFVTAQRLAMALRRSDLHCEGVNLYLADGAAAGQDVSHVHLHVLPRFAGDGVHPPGFAFGKFEVDHPSRDTLERHADAIRSALRRA